ncbi:MAG: hypothetical protein E2577_17290, partial [Starkeya sp.]|nr:hypothetical protein [Starkeya sp.]
MFDALLLTRRAALRAALLTSLTGAVPAMTQPSPAPPAATPTAPDRDHPYVGLWVTADRYVRHELLPNGRYDEARGQRESAYRGRYEVRGAQIDYWDDTGFTADGVFVDENTLH